MLISNIYGRKMFWTPCVARCLYLMLEDSKKTPKVKNVIHKGISLVGFIFNLPFISFKLNEGNNRK